MDARIGHLLIRGVADAEAPAHVEHVEGDPLGLGEGGQPAGRGDQRLGVEDLRAEVDVETASAQTGGQAAQQLGALAGRDAELGAVVAGRDVAVRVHVDARCDPYEDILLASLLAAQRGQALGVIAAIEDDQPRVSGKGRA